MIADLCCIFQASYTSDIYVIDLTLVREHWSQGELGSDPALTQNSCGTSGNTKWKQNYCGFHFRGRSLGWGRGGMGGKPKPLIIGGWMGSKLLKSTRKQTPPPLRNPTTWCPLLLSWNPAFTDSFSSWSCCHANTHTHKHTRVHVRTHTHTHIFLTNILKMQNVLR